MEAETFLTLGTRLGYVTTAESSHAMGMITQISKMLTSLRTKLRSRESIKRTR